MTQITDEISRAASLAYVQTKGVKEVDGEAMMNALTTAYPLIRAAVLEEAAVACETFPDNMDELYLFATGYKAKAERLAKVIRDMAKEG